MKRFSFTISALLFALLLASCDKSKKAEEGAINSTPTSTPGGGGKVKLEDFCPTLAEQACRVIPTEAGQDSTAVNDCLTRIKKDCEFWVLEPAKAAIEAGRLEYSEKAVSLCKEFQAVAEPSTLSASQKQEYYEECYVKGIFRGKQKAGESCRWGAECVPDTLCVAGSAPQCGQSGTCVTYPKAGESCATLRCDPSQSLDCVDMGKGTKTCVASAQEGGMCTDDAEGYPRCEFDPMARAFTDLQSLAAGQLGDLTCVKAASADSDKPGVCKKSALEGEPCDVFGRVLPNCLAGLDCVTMSGGSSVCRRLAGKGEPCDSLHREKPACNRLAQPLGLFCVGPKGQEACQSLAGVGEGEACSVDGTLPYCGSMPDGKPLMCVGTGTTGTCRRLADSVGSPCSLEGLSLKRVPASPDCDRDKGLYCNSYPTGQCAAFAAEGSQCGASLVDPSQAPTGYTLTECDPSTSYCSGSYSFSAKIKYADGFENRVDAIRGTCVASGKEGEKCAQSIPQVPLNRGDTCRASNNAFEDLDCDEKTDTCVKVLDFGKLLQSSYLCRLFSQ